MDISLLFDTSDFPPRWHCGHWTALHGWVHVVADLVIALAYFAIPATLAYFLRKRRGVPFSRLGWLFCLFIMACGAVHLIEATIFWNPWYRLSALVKVVTAVVSLATVVTLIPFIPRALALPGLESMNERLTTEVEARKRIEAELLQRNAMLDQFARVASHDLKAPLRSIEHLLEWSVADAGDNLDPEVRTNITDAQTRAQRLRVVIDNLLEFARADNHSHPVEPVRLCELVDEIVFVLHLPQGLHVQCDSSLRVECWRVPLRQVLYNLIVNAQVHGKGRPGVIEVTVEHEETRSVVRVQDPGPGIPAAARERIFDVGDRLGARIGNDLGGSGVGLAIVRRLVASWGGEVRAVETSGESGACFEFTIPRPFRSPRCLDDDAELDPDDAGPPAALADDAASPEGAGSAADDAALARR